MNSFPITLPMLQPAAGGSTGSMMTTFVTLGLIIAIFYFLIIRPQNKKQKETQKMLESLQKGDRVSTIGGIRGTVSNVKEDVVVLKVADNMTLEFSKSAVASVLESKAKNKDEKESK